MSRIVDQAFRDFAAEQGWAENGEAFKRGVEYIEDVVTGYIGALLWSESCHGTAPLDVCDHNGYSGERLYDCDRSLSQGLNYGGCDLAESAYDSIRQDVAHFVVNNWADLYEHEDKMDGDQAGYDFLLTRNGHGTGFWDRGLGKRGERLTANSEPYGSTNAYVGDDGRIYLD